jgi:flagellar biosynthesis component FlhA
MVKKEDNCINCNHCSLNKKNGQCELDFHKTIVPMFELEATWCTRWIQKEAKVNG